jgi:hypothetical protein
MNNELWKKNNEWIVAGHDLAQGYNACGLAAYYARGPQGRGSLTQG